LLRRWSARGTACRVAFLRVSKMKVFFLKSAYEKAGISPFAILRFHSSRMSMKKWNFSCEENSGCA
jgi:hypothetical protein